MRKLALLLVSLVLVFSLSSVFATEEEVPVTTIGAEADTSAEVAEDVEITSVEEGNEEMVNETISGEEDDDEAISGEVVESIDNTDSTTDETTTPETTTSSTKEDTKTTSSNNGSIVGAIIAVVIVVAVVAIAAILRKD